MKRLFEVLKYKDAFYEGEACPTSIKTDNLTNHFNRGPNYVTDEEFVKYIYQVHTVDIDNLDQYKSWLKLSPKVKNR